MHEKTEKKKGGGESIWRTHKLRDSSEGHFVGIGWHRGVQEEHVSSIKTG